MTCDATQHRRRDAGGPSASHSHTRTQVCGGVLYWQLAMMIRPCKPRDSAQSALPTAKLQFDHIFSFSRNSPDIFTPPPAAAGRFATKSPSRPSGFPSVSCSPPTIVLRERTSRCLRWEIPGVQSYQATCPAQTTRTSFRQAWLWPRHVHSISCPVIRALASSLARRMSRARQTLNSLV